MISVEGMIGVGREIEGNPIHKGNERRLPLEERTVTPPPYKSGREGQDGKKLGGSALNISISVL